MTIRSRREDRGISQEQLADTTRLSLRTIQRVEAGHRVSYASLRALATAFAVDVDLLERELYAMHPTRDEYVEKPLWIRMVLGLPFLRRLDRAGLARHETSLVAYALFAYAASFIVPEVEFPVWGLTTVDAMYFSAFSALLLALAASMSLRFRDQPST